MSIREVREAFEEHVNNIPCRFIDLSVTPIRLIERDAVKAAHIPAIESITEADIEQHTSYANQRREDVIRTMIKGVVKYAVLSHTWQESGEFTYQDMTSSQVVRDSNPGWNKLEQFVRIAQSTFNCQFAWADTVCINPGTPNDRQAAARSGFDWFRHAYVCIVYLASARSLLELERDKWFRRGWPLPELLAPIRIKFYGATWQPLNVDCPITENDRADMDFLNALSRASGISINDLRSFLPGPNRVREKLSWASKRETTVPEDVAYSLISVFVSPMEINPGEGESAFLRLMLQIIPRSHECDVFAWAGRPARNHPAIPSSPACYGTQHRDRPFHSNPHRYRLCGDRSFSLGYGFLRIKVVFVDIILNKVANKALEYTVTVTSPSHRDSASISKVEPLSRPLAGAQMTIGVIDYDWTHELNKGQLRRGECYFGFLLQRGSKEAKWEKLATKKVVFLENRETKKHKLQELHLF